MGDLMMNKKYDPLKSGLRPLLAKTLQNALSHRIAKEFPRIGGPRICQLCAEMILEVVNNYIRPKEHVHHGQIVWIAVDKDNPPGMSKKMADTDVVTVVLDASTAEDVQARINREPPYQWRLRKAIRMCKQAYEQGGLLTNHDLAEIMSFPDSLIAQMLAKHERDTKKLALVAVRSTMPVTQSLINGSFVISGMSKEKIQTKLLVRHITVLRLLIVTLDNLIALNCSIAMVEVYRNINQELGGENA